MNKIYRIITSIFEKKDIWRMLIAEFVGTMFLVLIGCAACVKGWDQSYSPTKIQVAISFGITIATMVQVKKNANLFLCISIIY